MTALPIAHRLIAPGLCLLCALTGTTAAADPTETPKAAAFATRRIATGVVIPDRDAVIAARIVGRIAAIPHREGASVERGAVLVQLDDQEWQAELAGTQASAQLAQIEVQRKRKHKARIQDLRERRSVSEDAMDNATFDLAAAQASLRVAQANVARVKATLAETRIVAPFAGVITSQPAEVGEVTSPGEPLIEIQDHRRLKLATRVKEKDLPFIAPGQAIGVTIDALGDELLQGQVSKLIPAGDARTHTFTVEIDLPATEGLYPGMFGQARF